jgi:hypothetical protein
VTEQTKTRIPAPLYAAAGAGDLAYEQLRKLPAVVNQLTLRAAAGTAELREKATARAIGLRERGVSTDLDTDRLREIAKRNAAAFVAGAQAAQERAVAVYGELVARGERVVGGGIVDAADVVNADIEATTAPAELPAAPVEVIERAKAAAEPARKPAKRTRTAPKK